MKDEDPSDEEWDRWMSLTDAQQDAELKAAEAEYSRWFDALSQLQQWQRRVRTCSDLLIRQKAMSVKHPFITWFANSAKKTERRLEKLLKEKPGES